MSLIHSPTWSGGLSICIATYNRAAFLAETLKSVLAQITDDVEVVVSDNASTDNTEQVVHELSRGVDRLRYFRQVSNVGLDRNFDRAVELAQGRYCWLLGDDDLLNPGAIAAVLAAIDRNYSLILVNGESKIFSTSRIAVPSYFASLVGDRVYGRNENDRIFRDLGNYLITISCFVIRRSVWMGRDRARYYGSMLIHVGVMFQQPMPGETLVIMRRLLTFRLDNAHSWQPEFFEIFWIKWPAVVWSLAIAESTKRSHSSKEPWRRFRYLIPLRAAGEYRVIEYRLWIRPRLRSLVSGLAPLLVLLLPRRLLYQFYCTYSRMVGSRNSLYDALQRISTLPDRGVVLANGHEIGELPIDGSQLIPQGGPANRVD